MTKSLNLFGDMQEIDDHKVKRGWLEVKRIRNYKDATDKNKSCKNCTHLVKKSFGNVYYKCELISLMASQTSDIRLKCVCDLHKKQA